MGLVVWLAGCWIDLSDLDGNTTGTICADGGAPVSWFKDDDQDGYGGGAEAILACDPPIGFAAAAGDCDESDPTVNPAAVEACNGFDDDCDYQVDEGGASWCVDVDLDGHGDPAEVIHACDQPNGYVATCDDCDDASADVHPGAEEVDDGVDNDCDEAVDE